MTDYEPYVADPAEPGRRPRLLRWRPLVVAAIALILVAQLAVALIRDRAEQDPSLEQPAAEPTAEPDS